MRINKLEELVRTQYIDNNGYSDVVNRFGLETEDAGRININLNLCTQDILTRRMKRHAYNNLKEQEKLQSRKLVMKYTLDLKNKLQAMNN